jgi:transposase
MQQVFRSIAAPSTSNIDAKRLLRAIVCFVQGDPQSCRLVRAPTPEEEDTRRLHRERERL